MDGQQRTLSICEYVAGKFSYEFKNFFNQPEDIQRRILNYPLTIYVCEGTASEKLECHLVARALRDAVGEHGLDDVRHGDVEHLDRTVGLRCSSREQITCVLNNCGRLGFRG